MRNQTKRRVDEAEAGTKAKAGRALLWAGTLVLLGEVAFLLIQIYALWQSSGATTLGWIAAAGAVLQRLVAFLVWNDGLLLATAAKVLVLCCPLLAIGIGLGLVRSRNLSARFADAREKAAASLEGEQK